MASFVIVDAFSVLGFWQPCGNQAYSFWLLWRPLQPYQSTLSQAPAMLITCTALLGVVRGKSNVGYYDN